MKKMSLLTLLIASTFLASAQDATTNTTAATGAVSKPVLRTPMAVKTRFGIKAGINEATLKAKDYVETPTPQTTSKTSYYVGAFVNIPIGGLFKLQPELVFSSQGSKMQETRTGPSDGLITYNYEEELKYLNVPVMVQLQTRGGFVVETGPQLGFLFRPIQKGTSPISTTDKTDINMYRDNYDFSWGLGIGYLSRIGLGIGARYNYGIANIINDKSSSDGALRNRVWQFGLSYQFGAYK